MSEGNLKQILTLGNSIIGVSILAMPYCLKQCGLVLGIILLIISGYINRINCHFLIKSAISTKRRSYEFLAFHIFGPMGKFAIEVIQIGFLFGICVSFFVIAGDLGPKILAQVLDIEYTDRFRAFFLCGLCFFIVLPLSLLRNTDSLASISAISITFYVLLVLKIVSDSWRHILTGSWQAEVELWRPAGVLQALPIMSLALACQTNVFSIYESLPDPSLSRMNTVVAGAINLCSSVYILVGFFGYVAFHDVPFGGNILVQLLPSPVTRWINIGFVMSIALGFPLVVYPCRVSVNSLLFRRPGSSLELPQNHIPELRFKCITFCILITAMCIGIVIPSIEVVLGLLGSTMGTAIAILFPSVMFIKNTSRNNLEKMAAQMSFILGIVLLVCGTYMNLYAVDQLAQEPVPAPVPAVTAPPAVSSPDAAAAAAAAVGAPALSNVTDKKDLVPDKPPGDTDGDGRQGDEKSKKAPPEEEARKEPAIPEPPADEDAEKTAKDGDTNTDDEKKAAGKKRKTSAEETENRGDAAGGKKKPGGRKSKHRDSKKNDDGAADAAEDAEAEAGAGDAADSAGDAEKRAAAVGEGLDVGALQKEEEERERDDALRPAEDPQAKELELKQEAVLQKLEETHKEQKELLQEQKALLKEMKQQRSEQEIEAMKRANQEAAGVGVQQQQQQQQQQPAIVQQVQQQPGLIQQQSGLLQQQQQPAVVQQQQQQQQPVMVQQVQQQPGLIQQQPGLAQQQQQPGMVQQQPGLLQQQQQPGIAQQQPGMVQEQQQSAMAQQVQQQPGLAQQQQQPGIAQQQPGIVQQQPGIVQQQPGIVQQQPGIVQQQPGIVQQQPGIVQQQPGIVQQQPGIVQQQPGIVQQQQTGMAQQQQPAGQVPPALGQGQQQQFIPNQPLMQKQVQQQLQQQQQQQQPEVNQAGPAVNIPSLQDKQPAPIPVAAAAASKRERAPAQQKTADTDTAQKKHNKHASHGRVRREAAGSAEDEMLVRLAENWAAMEAGGVAARATARRR